MLSKTFSPHSIRTINLVIFRSPNRFTHPLSIHYPLILPERQLVSSPDSNINKPNKSSSDTAYKNFLSLTLQTRRQTKFTLYTRHPSPPAITKIVKSLRKKDRERRGSIIPVNNRGYICKNNSPPLPCVRNRSRCISRLMRAKKREAACVSRLLSRSMR